MRVNYNSQERQSRKKKKKTLQVLSSGSWVKKPGQKKVTEVNMFRSFFLLLHSKSFCQKHHEKFVQKLSERHSFRNFQNAEKAAEFLKSLGKMVQQLLIFKLYLTFDLGFMFWMLKCIFKELSWRTSWPSTRSKTIMHVCDAPLRWRHI